MLSKNTGGTYVMINELIKGGDKSICFKHFRDITHPANSVKCCDMEIPATSVYCCDDILNSLDSEVEIVGIENIDYFNYRDIIELLKKLIRKNYKIIITGKSIVIDKFTT